MGWCDIPSTEETENTEVAHQDHFDTSFDSQGVGHKEFVQERKTVNAEFNIRIAVMDRILKRIQQIRPVAFCFQDFCFLHFNAPAHKTASVCQFLTPKKNATTFYHTHYSPDLSPPDHFPFSKLKMSLKGLFFADVFEMQSRG